MPVKNKILIIDDNADLRENYRTILESHGFKVIEAENGVEGLQKVKQDTPDLIILDVMMNDLTEGFHVAQTLRSKSTDSEYNEYKNIPIMILSSIHKKYDFHFDRDVGTEWLPVDIFLNKPLEPDVLIKKINEILNPEY
ncbi:response regulator [candidate division KSB1 bacterium]|nr:response regulator [candidate division KSB1 bacterium]